MNIYDFAMKMELDGKIFYENLARNSTHEGVRRIFLELAADEQKHYELFYRMKENSGAGRMTQSSVLDLAKNLYCQMVADPSATQLPKSDLDAYRQAMKAERESASLYRDAASKETDPEVRELLVKIADEEEKHFNIIENIYLFVNAPNESMVWSESNPLDEY